ncbi:putative Superoxide dismutase (Cu-Zn) [Hypsibius exemplaris]|uniref:Superoxide dismutase (Cu-Zn) n=1 Tax=Hypsibius exemplaris TaxID=2072580 RepID=A0A9X6NFY7_HYPEX|nr:putative Superoxide dismutase (Cu-Zn) [Hypsibius exemplaris]
MADPRTCLTLFLLSGVAISIHGQQGYQHKANRDSKQQGGRANRQTTTTTSAPDYSTLCGPSRTRVTKATAYVSGWSQLSGDISGHIDFSEQSPGSKYLLIEGEISGLNPGLHGLEIDEYGNLDESCSSFGSYFDPTLSSAASAGGQSADTKRFAGDLDNIQAGSNKKSTFKFSNDKLSLNGADSIIGRMVVLLEQPDDYGAAGRTLVLDNTTADTGNSRIACGVIGIQTEVQDDSSSASANAGTVTVTTVNATGPGGAVVVHSQHHSNASAPAGAGSYGTATAATAGTDVNRIGYLVSVVSLVLVVVM